MHVIFIFSQKGKWAINRTFNNFVFSSKLAGKNLKCKEIREKNRNKTISSLKFKLN